MLGVGSGCRYGNWVLGIDASMERGFWVWKPVWILAVEDRSWISPSSISIFHYPYRPLNPAPNF